MKKICFVTTIAASLRTFLLKTAEALYQTGEFDIYFMASPDPEIEKEFPKYIHFIPVEMKRGISLDLFRAIKNMRRIFEKERFDVVQYFTPNASFYASIASKQAKIPVRIYTQWGMIYVAFSGLKRRVFKTLEKITCANSTYIEVENRANLRFSHEENLYPQTKGVVVGNGSAAGVSLERYDISKKEEYRAKIRSQYQIQADSFVFGFMGRVTKDKGINEILTAAKRIIFENENVVFMIVGSVSEKTTSTLDQQLYSWAQTCPQIIFTGRTPVPEQYYAAMDCYVMPSYREGFGMTVIEAQAMGLPVIVSEITGHEDTMIPGKTGVYVKVKDVDSLYDAMEKMMKDKGIGVQIGLEGRKYVAENFEQKELIKQIVDIRLKLVQ